jgi:hypothetical protein
MHMHMQDVLPPHPSGIDHGAESVRRSLLCCQPVGKQKHLPQHLLVAFIDIRQGIDMELWNQHEVHRRHRVNVMEGQDFVVLVHLAAGDFTPDYLAENAVVGGHVGD